MLNNIKINKPTIVILMILVIQLFTAVIVLFNPTNEWYGNGQLNFTYDYSYFWYSVTISIIVLIVSAFVQIISEGKLKNYEFFFATCSVILSFAIAIAFVLIFLSIPISK